MVTRMAQVGGGFALKHCGAPPQGAPVKGQWICSVLAMLAVPGGMLGVIWCPNKNRISIANTQYSKCSRVAAQDGSCNFCDLCWVTLAQNSMNFHGLASEKWKSIGPQAHFREMDEFPRDLHRFLNKSAVRFE